MNKKKKNKNVKKKTKQLHPTNALACVNVYPMGQCELNEAIVLVCCTGPFPNH